MGDSGDDIDIALSPVKKSAPKQGRRAMGAESASSNRQSEGSASLVKSRPMTGDIWLDDTTSQRPRGTAPPRRAGGWADENARSKTAKSFRGGTGPVSDSDDEVPAIPDLEEVEQEDLALQVADAPSVAVNRVATYKELDSDLFKHAAFATLDDIDLRLLTRCMASEASIKESDENWTWDVLFTDVSSELMTEWFPDLEENNRSTSTLQDRPYTAFNRFPV